MDYTTFQIKDNESKNIYYFLKNKGFSENYISNLRKTQNAIILNGITANTRYKIKSGDKLEILNSPNAKTNIQKCNIALDIVFEDAYYLLIYKPSGLSCMPNRSHYDLNLAGGIMTYMEAKDPNFTLRIMNRLDKDTAGFILVAKSSVALQEVKDIDKTYYAICKGEINNDVVINKKIETVSNNGINEHKRIISENGKEATTFVYPISSNKEASLLKIKIKHGRTHQIRVHLSSIEHPLIGDEIYGQKSKLISHTALVCNEFSFYHPYASQNLYFSHPFPSDFKNTCDTLSLN